MDDVVLKQLVELARAFNNCGIKPVICGGLGIYLCFHEREGQVQSMIRATSDIDLMLTKQDVFEEAKRIAIAEIITDQLEYVVSESKKHHGFVKHPNQQLDVLAPPIEGLETENYRLRIVKSRLHGRITHEACFIDEDLKTISLSGILPGNEGVSGLEIQVPSPTNLLILKLCAFDDRNQGTKEDLERAQTHAFDIYITIMLTNRNDYLESQKFLALHSESEEIQKVISIVNTKFSSIDQPGWQHVLGATSFYPDLNIQQKRDKLEKAKNRLVKWFAVS